MEDTGLLDWLSKHDAQVHRSGPKSLVSISWWNGCWTSWTEQFEDVRDAIRAAKNKQGD